MIWNIVYTYTHIHIYYEHKKRSGRSLSVSFNLLVATLAYRDNYTRQIATHALPGGTKWIAFKLDTQVCLLYSLKKNSFHLVPRFARYNNSSAVTPVWKWLFKQAGSLIWRRFLFAEMYEIVCTMRFGSSDMICRLASLLLEGLGGKNRKGIGKSDERKYSYKRRRCIIYRVYYLWINVKKWKCTQRNVKIQRSVFGDIHIYKWSFLSHINFGETIILSRAISERESVITKRLTQKWMEKKGDKTTKSRECNIPAKFFI